VKAGRVIKADLRIK